MRFARFLAERKALSYTLAALKSAANAAPCFRPPNEDEVYVLSAVQLLYGQAHPRPICSSHWMES
jgi:hypothetical protein